MKKKKLETSVYELEEGSKQMSIFGGDEVAQTFEYADKHYIVVQGGPEVYLKLKEEGVMLGERIKEEDLHSIIINMPIHLRTQAQDFNRAMDLLNRKESLQVIGSKLYEELTNLLYDLQTRTEKINSLREKLLQQER